MKDILYSLLGTIEGNSVENLKNPVDKVDQIINDAIETFGDIRGGGIEIAEFLDVHIPVFAVKNDIVSHERIRLSSEKIKRAVKMFN